MQHESVAPVQNFSKERMNNIPDEIILNVFQYLTKDELKKTRTLSMAFQSDLVKRFTMFVEMEDAIRANNMENMEWIKERYNGDTRWHDDINFGTFFICICDNIDN